MGLGAGFFTSCGIIGSMKMACKMTDDGKQKPQITISVRNLVEFLLRSGDIDDRQSAHDSISAMQAGAKIHRKIQRKMGGDYHAEVPLKFLVSYEDYDFGIEGRADGIIYQDDEDIKDVTIDEIKGMYLDVTKLDEPVMVHEAQAKCYAYIFATEHGLQSCTVQMTYVDLDTEVIQRFKREYSYEELEDFFLSLLASYRRWSDYAFYERQKMMESIASLPFPFDYRSGQKKLVGDVYRSIVRGKVLFAQAPTGSGKTISTIYPAVQAVGMGYGEKIFYLTAKTVTRSVATDTFHLLHDAGYAGKTVEITAKDKMCPLDERACNPEDCPYAAGHFDRVNDAVFDFLQQESVFEREKIYLFAMERNVCPYEFNLDLSSWVDNIVCDYNYVFDPNVCLKRFFSEGRQGDYIFLIDEAHNLVERARQMYSETIVKEDVLYMKKLLKPYGSGLSRALDSMNRILLAWKKDCEKSLIVSDMDELVYAVLRTVTEMDRFFEKKIRLSEQSEILDFYFRLRNFLNLTEGYDEKYELYCDYNDRGDFCFHLFCMDPSRLLQDRLNRGRATVYFSATLLPVNYYKKLLCDTDPYAIYVDSIFDVNKRSLLIASDVTSKYTARNEDTYARYASYIEKTVQAKKGNYMVFFPSYQFLQNVYRIFVQKEKDLDLIAQDAHMSEDERDQFLKAFDEERETSLVAFCVMGGIFSEGIDLTFDRLIGAIIVGVGLPQIGIRRDILKNYFDRAGEDGFLYAYLYPGMNKVEQAAGRVIRTTEDEGVILLLDDRFLRGEYRNTFPREWQNYEICTLDSVEEQVTKFWESHTDK